MSRASVSALLALGAASTVAGGALAQDASVDRYGARSAPAAAVIYAPAPGPVSSGGRGPVTTAGPAMSRLRGRMLDWPGKVQDPAFASAGAGYASAQALAPPAIAARGYASSAYRRPGGATPVLRHSPVDVSTAHTAQARPYSGLLTEHDPQMGDPPRYAVRASPHAAPTPQRAPDSLQDASAQEGWRPVFAAAPRSLAPSAGATLAGAPTRSGLPTSIYAPAPIAQAAPVVALSGAAPRSAWAGSRAASLAPPMRTAMADRRYGYDPTQEHGVRFYSVHRPFGLKPDAAPIPPQFFTATADLAEPPGPLPTDRTTVSGGTTHTSRVVADPSAN